MLCHSVRSCLSPFLSVKRSSVASENFATLVPLGIERISGSLPRRPTRMTLFTDPAIWFSCSSDCLLQVTRILRERRGSRRRVGSRYFIRRLHLCAFFYPE